MALLNLRARARYACPMAVAVCQTQTGLADISSEVRSVSRDSEGAPQIRKGPLLCCRKRDLPDQRGPGRLWGPSTNGCKRTTPALTCRHARDALFALSLLANGSIFEEALTFLGCDLGRQARRSKALCHAAPTWRAWRFVYKQYTFALLPSTKTPIWRHARAW
jgi:hypothetical protein